MISVLRLQNFKCFQDQSIDFGKITLLSGLNGMGKSTVLQALLALRQSFQQGALAREGLALNGELVCLGTGQDVLYEAAIEENLGLSLMYDQDVKASWQFGYKAEADLLQFVQETPAVEAVFHTSLFTDDFHYLQAERIGPRTSFAVSDYIVDRHRQLGTRGEYTAHFLSVYGGDDIPLKVLARSAAPSQSLTHQIEAWLSVVSPGIRVEVVSHRGMDIVNLQYSFATGRQVSNSYRATNVGFGITYTLPILTAVLSSKPGSLLLLENPEAHLHPRGQVHIGELLALAAANGVQVIVETHSDHVLNGLRVAVHSGKIAPADVRLHYFGRYDKDGLAVHEVVQPRIDRNGRIDRWPAGFFDELDNSLAMLLAPAEAE